MTLSDLQQNIPYCNVLSPKGPKGRKVRRNTYIRKAQRDNVHKKGDRYITARDNGRNCEGGRDISEGGAGGKEVVRELREIRKCSEWGERREIADLWRREVEHLSNEERRVQEKRLVEFEKCGRVLKVRVCTECDTARDGSGTYEGTRTCKCKTCPSCSWIRSKRIGEFMEGAFDALKGSSDWCWQLVVMTIRYNPEDESELEVSGLRSRAFLAIKASKVVWKQLLNVEGAAMLRNVECSPRGFVHLNLIYFGPRIDKGKFEKVTKAVDCRVGHSFVQNLDTAPEKDEKKRKKSEDSRGSKKALKSAVRYISKGIVQYKNTREEADVESWRGADHFARVIDPLLAARWEIATYKLKLLQKYGAIRGMKLEKHGNEKEKIEHNDNHVECPHCGVVGRWKTGVRRAELWIQQCHDRGSPALIGSVWTPKPHETGEVENYV